MNKIFSIQDLNGNLLKNMEDINKEVVKFFTSIFALKEPSFIEAEHLLDVIPKCVSVDQKAFLLSPISKKEIKSALFSLDGEKAPRLDGILAFFF